MGDPPYDPSRSDMGELDLARSFRAEREASGGSLDSPSSFIAFEEDPDEDLAC